MPVSVAEINRFVRSTWYTNLQGSSVNDVDKMFG